MMGHAAIADRYAGRVGQRIGQLRFDGLVPARGERNRILGKFVCDCGTVAVLPAGRVLNTEYRTHCGCKTDRGSYRTHGMRNSREYSSWGAMKARCLDPNNKDYPRWGGVGVTICSEWVSDFASFYAHIGPRPPNTSLDRIDSRLGYEPGNVRWATAEQQARNRRGTFRWFIKGEEFDTHEDAARHFSVSDHTVWRWVNGQFDKRRGLFTKPKEDCYVVARY